MVDRILIGKKGSEHGIWVSKPDNSVQNGGQYILSSVSDVLKIHAQGNVESISETTSEGLWRHDILVTFPELPYIPLAFMGFMKGGSEPFSFPPNLRDIVTTHYFGGSIGLVNAMPPVGINHNSIRFQGWIQQKVTRFNYTVFITKLRDKF